MGVRKRRLPPPRKPDATGDGVERQPRRPRETGGMKLFGIRWAPWRPMKRRVQAAATGFLSVVLFPGSLAVTLALLLYSRWTAICMSAYLLWIFALDPAPTNGNGRPSKLVQLNPVWWLFRDYLPASLRVEAALDKDKQYIFGVHPHGIISMAMYSTLCNDSLGFLSRPTTPPLRVVTVPFNFYVPFWRDWLLGMGLVSASRSSFQAILRSGKSLAVVVGGAEESRYARPCDEVRLFIRRGFIRMALLHGLPLVPCYSFGELDLFDQAVTKPGSIAYAVQEAVTRVTGVTPILFLGRGLFNYSFGFMPHRTPCTFVVGPIVPAMDVAEGGVTNEAIDEMQQRYTDALVALFDKHKHSCGAGHRTLRPVLLRSGGKREEWVASLADKKKDK